MTNLERWRFIHKDNPSPDNFLNFGFYFLISASLQRRVWLASARPIYPNIYVALVGRAGLGKGLTTTPVKEMLEHWKWDPTGQVNGAELNGKSVSSMVQQPGSTQEAHMMQMYEEIHEMMRREKERTKQPTAIHDEKPLLFPLAPDFITQQKLVNRMSRSKRRLDYAPDPSEPTVRKIYTHSSMAFVLDELGNLFEENQKAMNAFLLSAYTCLDKYEHDTIGRGVDRVTKPCVSMLAGCTPDFMRQVFTSNLLSEGFASRTFFLFESSQRFRRGHIPDWSPDQVAAKMEILEHMRHLSEVFGPVRETPEAVTFFDHWFEDEQRVRVNKSIKLEDYYARKLMHVYKIAMILLFSDQCESYIIEKHHIEQAIAILAIVEQRMHIALSFTEGRNPLSTIAGKLLKYILAKPDKQATRDELFIEFYSDLNSVEELSSCLAFLKQAGAVNPDGFNDDGKAVVKALVREQLL